MISNLETAVAVPQQNLTVNTSGRIAGDIVNRATADLPDEERSLIRRWHSFYIENEISLAEAGKIAGVGEAAVSLIFRGKYNAKLDNVIKELRGFFDLSDRRAEGRKLKFIETALTRRIWNMCSAALEFQKIGLMFGDQQIGKTEALKAYRDAHNHGSTIYVSMPTGGAVMNFLMELARVLRIAENQPQTRLRERVKRAFDNRMLLIVDECHRCIPDVCRSTRAIQSIEFVREIFDDTGCGVVLCATNVFRDAMDAGAVHQILRQTKRRRLCTLQLPNTPARADLNTFAAAYDLPPSTGVARDLEERMIDQEALGMWLTLLRMGAKIASQRKHDMKWDHVLAAHAGLKDLEQSK